MVVRRTLLALALATAACGPSDSSTGGDGGVDTLPPLPDADGDGISDDDEGRPSDTDTDQDGTADYLDDDSDADGIPDYREAGDSDTNTPPRDADTDGTPDFRDLDSDDNGREDAIDGTDDIDMDGLGDFTDLDDDGDNLRDNQELGDDPLNPIDSDGDTIPDFRDRDSDNDLISDADELARDPDGDMIPAFRDLDSDEDCRPDTAEAGDADLMTLPVDSDLDGAGDWLDLDSDNDGLLDNLEDINCNGQRDGTESSTTDDDTDDDGVTDLVEVAAGTNPNDPADNPQANGDFVFTVPYMLPPDPTMDTLDFATDISQADVAFAMDTTGSMGGEINTLKVSLGSIVSTLAADIPNIAFAVGGYDDFPTPPYGDPGFGDQPWYLRHRVMTVSTAPGLASVQAQVNSLTTHYGADGPESGWEALHQIATGLGTTVGAASVPAFNPATAPPVPVPAGESVGTIGGVGFRAGSLPIVVIITDYNSHNGNPGTEYSFAGAATRSSSISEAMGLGIRVIGVVSQGGDYVNAKADVNTAVVQTGALVPPAAWGTPGVDRPAGCAAAQCCTGINGAGEPTDGAGMCPLTFTVDGAGNGLGNAVTRAIQVLTTFGVIDIGATIADDPADAIDAVAAFVDYIQANPSAPAPCVGGLTAVDTNGDGRLDTFTNVNPGTVVCFDVVPKMNTVVMPLPAPQMFKATITVTGDGVTTLDTRDIYFLVPPEIPPTPVD
jgi:hypothetical protein